MQLPDREKDYRGTGCGDEHDGDSTLVGLSKEGGEPQSEKLCEECKHINEDLDKAPCHDCYVCRFKCKWEAEEQDEPDNEHNEVGRKDCSGCKTDMYF